MTMSASDEIKDIARDIRRLHCTAFYQYAALVDDVVLGRIRDEASIERIMDGLVCFCNNPECMELFKRLCRCTLYQYPQMVKDYIDCYRLLFESQPEEERNDD